MMSNYQATDVDPPRAGVLVYVTGAMQAIAGIEKVTGTTIFERVFKINTAGRGWSITGKGLGVAGGLLSLWDGMAQLTDAADAASQGRTISAENNRIMGRTKIFAGAASVVAAVVLTGVVGIVAGIFLGIIVLVVGYFFMTLVLPSVQTWVNRSILGEHEGQILPFGDIATEQSSLELVFQGVVVDLSWQDVRESTYSLPERKIKLKVTVPKLDYMYLGLTLRTFEVVDPIFDWSYEKNGKDADVALINSDHQLKEESQEIALTNATLTEEQPGFSGGSNPTEKPEQHIQSDFVAKGNCYVMEWQKSFGINELGGGISLGVVLYNSELKLKRYYDFFDIGFGL